MNNPNPLTPLIINNTINKQRIQNNDNNSNHNSNNIISQNPRHEP